MSWICLNCGTTGEMDPAGAFDMCYACEGPATSAKRAGLAALHGDFIRIRRETGESFPADAAHTSTGEGSEKGASPPVLNKSGGTDV